MWLACSDGLVIFVNLRLIYGNIDAWGDVLASVLWVGADGFEAVSVDAARKAVPKQVSSVVWGRISSEPFCSCCTLTSCEIDDPPGSRLVWTRLGQCVSDRNLWPGLVLAGDLIACMCRGPAVE